MSLRLGRCGQFLAYDLIHEFAVSTTLELRHDGAHHFAHVFRTARDGLAHGGTNRALLCRALGLPPGRLLSMGQDYGALTVLERIDTAWRLLHLNERPVL